MVRVVTEDRCSEWVKARAVSAPGEHEVLLSDKLLDAQRIRRAMAAITGTLMQLRKFTITIVTI
jgi:hypothetical protein